MIQRGQLVPLRLWDGYGGHCRDDLLFFVSLLRCVCVDAWDLPVGHKKKKKRILKRGEVNGNLPSGLFP